MDKVYKGMGKNIIHRLLTTVDKVLRVFFRKNSKTQISYQKYIVITSFFKVIHNINIINKKSCPQLMVM